MSVWPTRSMICVAARDGSKTRSPPRDPRRRRPSRSSRRLPRVRPRDRQTPPAASVSPIRTPRLAQSRPTATGRPTRRRAAFCGPRPADRRRRRCRGQRDRSDNPSDADELLVVVDLMNSSERAIDRAREQHAAPVGAIAPALGHARARDEHRCNEMNWAAGSRCRSAPKRRTSRPGNTTTSSTPGTSENSGATDARAATAIVA